MLWCFISWENGQGVLLILNTIIIWIESRIRCVYVAVIRRIYVAVSLSKSGSMRSGNSFLKYLPKLFTRYTSSTTTKLIIFITMRVLSTLEQRQSIHWWGVKMIKVWDGESAVNFGSGILSTSCGDKSSRWKPVIERSLNVLLMRLWYWSKPRIRRGQIHRVMPLIQASVDVYKRVFPPPVRRTRSWKILVFVVCAAKMVEPTAVWHS